MGKYGCASAKWQSNETIATKACYCGYYDDYAETVEAGSDYQACFLGEYRSSIDIDPASLIHNFGAAGIAFLAIVIGIPIVFCLCVCTGIYFCCCRSNNNQRAVALQQPTKLMMIPSQQQLVHMQ